MLILTQPAARGRVCLGCGPLKSKGCEGVEPSIASVHPAVSTITHRHSDRDKHHSSHKPSASPDAPCLRVAINRPRA